MSEIINNREYRQKILKEIIKELHSGKTVEEVKPKFEKNFKGVSVNEISQLEQALIKEGIPVEEIQRLCDVHAALFKGSIEEIHRQQKPEEIPGHPIHTFKLENRAIEKLILEKMRPDLEEFLSRDTEENRLKLLEDLNQLLDIDKHYSRKENLIFPYLEKYGITAPPKVMWGVDDEIREELKQVKNLLIDYKGNKEKVKEELNKALTKVTEMIFKEENILFPMVLETLSEDEFLAIAEESDEIGYCLIQPEKQWRPVNVNVESKESEEKLSPHGYIKFETGILTPKEISLIFNHLPVDITFVNKEGIVKYFSQGKERIFARTKSVIGRKVENCHPPASVHIVNKLVEDFKAGVKDHEDFWIKLGDNFVYIRYFAVRDEKGEYQGTLEVTQNIKSIQKITGEKRLLSE